MMMRERREWVMWMLKRQECMRVMPVIPMAPNPLTRVTSMYLFLFSLSLIISFSHSRILTFHILIISNHYYCRMCLGHLLVAVAVMQHRRLMPVCNSFLPSSSIVFFWHTINGIVLDTNWEDLVSKKFEEKAKEKEALGKACTLQLKDFYFQV